MKTRIAVICLAYTGKTIAIEWMANYLSQIDATLFIHVDEKVSIEPYKKLAGFQNIKLVTSRVRIFWGGFQTVEAIANSMAQAMDNEQFDRFLILTEDTIPVRSISDFNTRLKENEDFIVAMPVSASGGLKRYSGFYCYDDLSTCPRTPHDERVIGPALSGKLDRLEALRAKGKVSLPRLYHGSTWLGLSADAAGIVLDRHRNDIHFRESFEFSAVPEEQYFQTIYGEKYGETRRPLIITDFSRHPKPYVFTDPADVLIEAAKYPCLFLRKVDLSSDRFGEFVASLATK